MNPILESQFLPIAGGVGILVGIIVYALTVPKSSLEFKPAGASGSKGMAFLAMVGSQFINSMPASFEKAVPVENPRVKSLLVRSGNPWGVTVQEFYVTKFLFAFIGFVAGFPVWLVVKEYVNIPLWVIVPALSLLGFIFPQSKYSEQAKLRDLEFKRQLPEALDLLYIALSSGATFTLALRNSIPNMADGVLKEEFTRIIRNIDSGSTLSEALDAFAERAPNDGILTFVKSIKTANETNTPIGEILESRARESREEFFALVNEKAAQLSSKIWMVLAPTMMPAILIIAVAPSASLLQQVL